LDTPSYALLVFIRLPHITNLLCWLRPPLLAFELITMCLRNDLVVDPPVFGPITSEMNANLPMRWNGIGFYIETVIMWWSEVSYIKLMMSNSFSPIKGRTCPDRVIKLKRWEITSKSSWENECNVSFP